MSSAALQGERSPPLVYKVSYKAKGSSGIEQIYIEPLDDDGWYDMNGRRIATPVKKGVYIHGHRKVVIR